MNYLKLLGLILLTLSCQREIDEFYSKGNGDGIKFRVRSSSSNQITRATSSTYEEGRILNVYVLLFSFPNGYNSDFSGGKDEYDAENSVVHRWVLSDEQIALEQDGYVFTLTIDEDEFNISSGVSRYTFVVFANYGEYNTIIDIPQSSLNNIDTWTDLEALNIEMIDGNESIERGTNFFMYGVSDGMKKADFVSASRALEVNLERLDAKFRFNFKYVDHFNLNGEIPTKAKPRTLIKMNPKWWRLHNMPRNINVISKTKYVSKEDGINYIEGEDYFSTDKFNFEGIGDLFASEFSFYCLPQKYEPQKSIKEVFTNGYSFSNPALTDYDYSTLDIYSFDADGNLDETVENPDLYLDNYNNPKIPVWQHQWLTLREKREKIPTTSTSYNANEYQGLFDDGDFIYAPARSPYVEMRIELIYDLYDGEGVPPKRFNSTIDIILHLGLTGRTTVYPTSAMLNGISQELPPPLDLDASNSTADPDSYEIVSNTEYIYNIYFDGTSTVLLEAETGPDSDAEKPVENIPGMSGDLYSPSLYRLLNSGANVINFSFPTTSITNGEYQWALSTPFGSYTMQQLYDGNSGINGNMDNIDHKWVTFAVNPNSSVPIRPFLGNREHAPKNWFFYNEATGEIDDNDGFFEMEQSPTGPIGYMVPKKNSSGDYIPNNKYQEFMDAHLAYSNGGAPTKYLNINQLAQLIILNTSSDPLTATAYVDEYYYYEHPLEGGQPATTEDGLWAKFVNTAGRRSFSVVTKPKASSDQLSTYIEMGSIIEQEPLQTFYNLEKAGVVETQTPNFPFRVGGSSSYSFPAGTKFIGYGIEGLPVTDENGNEIEFLGQYILEAGDSTYIIPDELAAKVNNYRSGLKNTQAWWLYGEDGTLSDSVRWDKYINLDSWTLKDKYSNLGIYQCLLRNRDDNGNGVIDINEIKWYMPTKSQIIYMWIGAGALSLPSQIFRNNDYSYDLKFMMSSTVSRSRRNQNELEIVWLNEGSSTGFILDNWGEMNEQIDGPNGKAYIRCLRNLGTPKELEGINYSAISDMGVNEHEFAKGIIANEYNLTSEESGNEYISSVWGMSFQNISHIAYRKYTQIEDLPFHHISEDHNRPWGAMEVVNQDVSEDAESNTIYTVRSVREHNDNIDNDTDLDNNPCPHGWRLPNQREAATMALMFTAIPNQGWLRNYSTPWALFAPTRSYVRQATTPSGAQDAAFNIRYVILDVNGLVGNFVRMRLTNTGANYGVEKGIPRCVRDVPNSSVFRL